MTHKESRERNERIVGEAKEGATIESLASKYGLSLSYINHICRAGGYLFPRTRCKRINSMPIVAELCNTDKTLSVIAEEHGVTRQAVSLIYIAAKDAGVPVNERKPGRKACKESSTETNSS